MRQVKAFGLVGVFLLSASLTVKADVWDAGVENDNAFDTTENHLIHGSDQVHDLAAQGGVTDHDWFVLRTSAYSSFQLIIDGITSEVDFSAVGIQRYDGASPPTSLQNAFAIDGGMSRSMLWQNTTGATENGYIQVNGDQTGCFQACTANAQYRIRLLDTTYSVPRFNNANGQVTILLVQNSTGNPFLDWTANYWSVAGALLKQVPGVIGSYGTAVVNLSTIPELQNQTGAITITHGGGYGGLSVKSVALEPATGFSFDTPGTYRAR